MRGDVERGVGEVYKERCVEKCGERCEREYHGMSGEVCWGVREGEKKFGEK